MGRSVGTLWVVPAVAMGAMGILRRPMLPVGAWRARGAAAPVTHTSPSQSRAARRSSARRA